MSDNFSLGLVLAVFLVVFVFLENFASLVVFAFLDNFASLDNFVSQGNFAFLVDFASLDNAFLFIPVSHAVNVFYHKDLLRKAFELFLFAYLLE